jgi:chemotaxis protein CheC
MEINNISELEMDGLREIWATCAGRAATAMSQMINKTVDMSVPKTSLVPVTKVPETIGGYNTLIAGVHCRIMGELKGEFLLTFSKESAFSLISILLGKKYSPEETLGELDSSAIKEAGNIVLGTFVTALGKILGKDLFISVPQFVYDMAGAVVDCILIEFAEAADIALVLEIVFHDTPQTIDGKFFVIPNPQSMKIIVDAIREKLK